MAFGASWSASRPGWSIGNDLVTDSAQGFRRTGPGRQKRMDIWLINRFSYIILATVVLVGMGVYFARSGFTRTRALALGVAALAFFVAWASLRTGNGTTTSTQAATLVLRDSEQPVLVEFYSDYCAGCLAARPAVDSLERELGDRLRVVRLNVASAAGQDLATQLQVENRTPSFVLLDPDGNELWRGFGTFDDAAVRAALPVS